MLCIPLLQTYDKGHIHCLHVIYAYTSYTHKERSTYGNLSLAIGCLLLLLKGKTWVMFEWPSQLYTAQEVLHKFYDIVTDESDGENLELD